jgi:hypothetical protein
MAEERFDVLAIDGGITGRASRWTPQHKGKLPARKLRWRATARELLQRLDYAL